MCYTNPLKLVAVGDQSSGKSSVLESLTGFSFPQAPGLCSRYDTQISCRRAPETKVVVSIIPHPDVDLGVESQLRAFKQTISDLTNEALVSVMEEANKAMGIRMTEDDTDSGLQTFSEHILKIEISGPDQPHFTVIDVPGIFRVWGPTPLELAPRLANPHPVYTISKYEHLCLVMKQLRSLSTAS